MALARHNHICAVTALRQVSRDGGAERRGVDRSMTLGYPVFTGLCFEDTVAAAVDAMKPDIVIYQDPLIEEWVKLRGLIGHLPLIIYHHSIFPGMLEIYRSDEISKKRDLRSIANSETTQNQILRLGIRASIIPPVFGFERHNGCQRTGNDILMVSVQYGKGVDIALQLAENRPAERFSIVKSWGSQADLDRFQPWIDSLSNVTLHENMPDLSGLLKAAKLLLMPSRWAETWGRIASEAQLWGIPVLGSRRGQLPRTIGGGGLTLDPDGDFADWLAAFDRILADAPFYAHLAGAARARGQEILRTTDLSLAKFLYIAYELAA